MPFLSPSTGNWGLIVSGGTQASEVVSDPNSRLWFGYLTTSRRSSGCPESGKGLILWYFLRGELGQ